MRRVLLSLLALLAAAVSVRADVIVINFDNLSDGTLVTNQYAGVAFANAAVLTAGVSLNEVEFPPHSGTNVVFDNGGPISLNFATPVVGFGGYFTYAEPLMVDAFDASGNLLGIATSLFSSNDALLGDPGSAPNEFLSLSFASGISSITITGDSAGGSFVLDDVTLTTTAVTPVPEPSTIALLAVGAVLRVCWRLRLRRGDSYRYQIPA